MQRTIAASIETILKELHLGKALAGCFDGRQWAASGQTVQPITPITGEPIGPSVTFATPEDTRRCIENMMAVKKEWAAVPAPRRGEIVRQIGCALRESLVPLGQLLALEVGKVATEGRGEVQEFIDIADFAAGLSRQIPGQVLPSERPGHFMMEQWHPLGAIGIICAFNFPIAVAGWNAAISLVAGNTQVWKCAPTTPLCSIATQRIITNVLERNGIPPAVCTFVAGGADVGETIVDSKHLPLVSFTGSCAVGARVAQRLAGRFGRALLELGGNNAIFVHEDANVDMALRAALFGAVGTCGQRCTTCRRLYVHKALYEAFRNKLAALYPKLTVGNPLEEGIIVGPLHSLAAVRRFEETVEKAVAQGGKVLYGGKSYAQLGNGDLGPHYVQPTLIEMPSNATEGVVAEEVFAPILYVMSYSTIDEAIALNNGVEQGLSAALFTRAIDVQYAWLGPNGADTGIANVNVPTNGAEIGGAFGGEKATGGGRESGSDAWKQYMRRQTSTVNYSTALPLAQGVTFDV